MLGLDPWPLDPLDPPKFFKVFFFKAKLRNICCLKLDSLYSFLFGPKGRSQNVQRTNILQDLFFLTQARQKESLISGKPKTSVVNYPFPKKNDENMQEPLSVGGFNPFWKILVKLDHLPQVGVKIKNIWNHHLASHHKSRLNVLVTYHLTDPLWRHLHWSLAAGAHASVARPASDLDVVRTSNPWGDLQLRLPYSPDFIRDP